MKAEVLKEFEKFNLHVSETEEHLTRVQKLTEALIHFHKEYYQLSLSDAYIEAVIKASILHDIGKIAVPETILYKNGSLDERERMIVETHPISGMYIMKKILDNIQFQYNEEEFKIIRNIIHCHHEHWNGEGYPNRIKETDIPLEARIISIVDVYDALTNKRCYKKAWTKRAALLFIKKQSGKMFDPKIVESFLNMMEKNKR